MAFRIEAVDPLTAAAAVSSILQTAWKPPCLNYSPAYLAWQLSFPGVLRPKVVLAFDEHKEVGCASVTQRSFVFKGTHIDAYVLSFVAVKPAAQGQGIARAIYATLIDTLLPDIPVIAFAEPDSAGEHVLINSFKKASFYPRRLQPCRAIGYMHTLRRNPLTNCYVTPTSDPQEFNSVIPRDHRGIMWNRPTSEQFNHYHADPRRRAAILVRNGDGTPFSSGMMVDAEIVFAQGTQTVRMLESVCIPSNSAEGLRAAFSFGAPGGQESGTIMASNLSYLDDAVIKGSGARVLPSSFNAHIFLPTPNEIFSDVLSVNLEVI